MLLRINAAIHFAGSGLRLVTALLASVMLTACLGSGFDRLPKSLELELNTQGFAATNMFLIPESRAYQISIKIDEEPRIPELKFTEQLSKGTALKAENRWPAGQAHNYEIRVKETSTGKLVVKEQFQSESPDSGAGKRHLQIDRRFEILKGLYVIEIEQVNESQNMVNARLTLNMKKAG